MENTINQRISKILETKSYKSKRAFAQKIGISQTSFNDILNGAEPKYSTLNKILSVETDINPEWLLTGEGKILKDEFKVPVLPISDDTNAVYLYDVSAAAGYGSFDTVITENNVIGKYSIPDFKHADFMIYVTGSSMYPKYSSGDIIACKKLYETKFIQWGKVYVIATEEQGLLVKRLKPSEKEDCIKAVSDNPGYEPFDIPNNEICGLALVLGVLRLE